ncbi:hypothetical protein A3K73_08415 [Candidatus Pacearchaeota archaeon RBG_13_36_9]|nr:MAG: hypothetical protein A3K73_08415 [Candidatus Pacearchaeota archaeon RBG_13_36_9]
MKINYLTRREFMGVFAAVLGACVIPSYARVNEEEVKCPASGDDDEKLNNVVVEAYPLIGCKERVRIFEISTKLGGWSRASEVNKNTGEEYWQYKIGYSACGKTSVEDVEKHIVCLQRDCVQIQAMYNRSFW